LKPWDSGLPLSPTPAAPAAVLWSPPPAIAVLRRVRVSVFPLFFPQDWASMTIHSPTTLGLLCKSPLDKKADLLHSMESYIIIISSGNSEV
jgi:hypothetical protein